jgi:hypothetical protein
MAVGNTGGTGGAGVASDITGSSVSRAGGAGGAGFSTAGLGTAGGGNGGIAPNYVGTAGTANTGGGGGSLFGTGGSGIVVIRYPSNLTIGGGAGLTFTTATVGANKVTTFTAGTGTISFS